jgi:hypothetical protein
MTTKPWYRYWQVWLCLVLFALWWVLEVIVGIPLRLFEFLGSFFR